MPYLGNIVQDFSVNTAMLNSDSVTSIKIADGTIVNADINASAAIDVSKLSGVLPLAGGTLTGALTMPNGSNSAAAINFGDSDSGIFGGTNTVSLAAGGTTRFTAATGVSIVGATDITGSLTTTGPLNIPGKIFHVGDTDTALGFPSANVISFETSGSERLRIDANGRVLYGKTSNRQTRLGNNSFSPNIQIEDSSIAAVSFTRFNDNTSPFRFVIQKGRGSVASPAAVLNNDVVGQILFSGHDGSNFCNVARIDAEVDGAPGTDDMPGNLIFSTTSDGVNTTTERMRITSAGRVGIGTASPSRNLHVVTSENNDAATIINNDTTNGYGLNVQGGGSASARYILRLAEAGGTEKLRVDSSGNLGIGTGSSISSRLHVFGTSGTYPTVQINHSAADTEGEFLRLSRTDVTTIRYHSIKAKHSGNAAANTVSVFLHDGSGDPFTGQIERLRIQGNGRIGMGTTNPGSALEVRTSEANGIISRCTATQTTDTNKAFRVRNNSNSNTVTISYKGRIDAVTVNETSDIALKENIQPLSNTLEKIKQITGYKYNFKDSETNSVGVIAQDVEKVFPELVHGEEGTKKLQYSGLVGALIEAVKELSDKVTKLEAA